MTLAWECTVYDLIYSDIRIGQKRIFITVNSIFIQHAHTPLNLAISLVEIILDSYRKTSHFNTSQIRLV